jgi:hypothetical protein
MACNNSCATQIACAIAVAAATFIANAVLGGTNSQQQPARMQFEVIPPPWTEPPPRFCRTLPDGRRYCCEHGRPQVWDRAVRTPHGTRVRRSWICP